MSDRMAYLIETPDGETLLAEWTWTVSRAADTYGHNRCTLRIDGKRVAACVGGGYDMRGTCFADWLQQHAAEGLKTLSGNRGTGDKGGFYGLTFYHPTKGYSKRWRNGCKTILDGGCGFESIHTIAAKLGYKLAYKGR